MDHASAPISSPPWISPARADAAEGLPLLAVRQRSAAVRHSRAHRHARGQLLGADEGLLSVEAGDSRWVVPAGHAVWIPPGVSHAARSHGPFAGWSLYVVPAACAALPPAPCVVCPSALLREGMARLAAWPATGPDARRQRLEAVMFDELAALVPVAWELPMPSERRLRRIAQALCDHPANGRSLPEWARWAGLSPRSVSRHFVAETGLSFTAWRQRVRLMRALQWLAEGKPVAVTAWDLGYENPSAFIALFRRAFGMTPGQYLAGQGALTQSA